MQVNPPFPVFTEKDLAENEKVLIIIPTYNEAAVIKSTLEQLFAATESAKHYDIHVLVFDSASTDNTRELVTLLQKQYPKLHLSTEPKKTGLGSAYFQAMTEALTTQQADIIFEFDADLSHQPKYILPMLEQIKTSDCVLGSRYVAGGSIPDNWTLHRKFFSILGNYITRIILTLKFKDFTSGFRATRRQHLIKILSNRFITNHYAYKIQLLWLLHKNKAKICEYPIDFLERTNGYSKLPTNSIIDSFRVVLTLRYREIEPYLKMHYVKFLSYVLQMCTYNVIRQYTLLPPFDAEQLAVIVAIINEFVMRNKITSKNRKRNERTLFSRINYLLGFILYSVFVIKLQSYWLDFGIIYLGSGPIHENFIMGTGICLMSFLHYFIHRLGKSIGNYLMNHNAYS